MDDGEPQTCRRRGQLLTTWRNPNGCWVVHVESVKQYEEGAIDTERVLAHGHDRLSAYEFAKGWIDGHVGQSL